MIFAFLLFADITIAPAYHTNTDFYYDLVSAGAFIYGATNGGVVRYDFNAGDFTVLTNTDGLPLNRQICISLDGAQNAWVGSEAGLAVIDPLFTSVYRYPSDYLTNIQTQEIHCRNDSIYVGSYSGLLFIDTKGTPMDHTDDFRLRVFKADGLPSENVLTVAVDDTSIWVGTDNYLAVFAKDFYSLKQYGSGDGLLSPVINDIEIHDSIVYVASPAGLNRWRGDHFDTLLIDTEIHAIATTGDSLLLALDTLDQVGIYTAGSLFVIKNNLPYHCRVPAVTVTAGTIVAGLGNRYARDYFGCGLAFFNSDSARWQIVERNSIPSNHISDITANEHGVFVACGRRSRESKGLGWLRNDGQWLNFDRDSILPTNHIHRCITTAGGKVWCGINTFSSVAADTFMAFSYDPATDEWFFMRNRFLDMEHTEAVWDLQVDHSDNLYLALAGTADKVYVIDSLMTQAYRLDEQRGFVVELALGSDGRIWRTFATDKTLRLIDTRNTLFDRSDDLNAEYGVTDGLVAEQAYGCLVDEQGVLYLANTSRIMRYDSDGFALINELPENDYFDLVFDSENRICILARDGVFWYEPAQGIAQEYFFDNMNVAIEFLPFSNELIQVQGFEFDPLRHCLWLGGETGLLQLEIEYDTLAPLDDIIIYPNPVRGTSVLRIKNIPPDAMARIFSISGRLIADALEPDDVFGEIVWNIPDDLGSGLYFVHITSDRGQRICKFAIAR